MFSVFSLVVFCGGWAFVFRHRHLLVMLLGLEMMMLGIFGMLSYSSGLFGGEIITLVFLTFVVCEGRIGLGLLVSVVRAFGNDYFYNLSVLQC